METPEDQPCTETTQVPPKPRVKIVPRPQLHTWTFDRIVSTYVPVSWQKIFDRSIDERREIGTILTQKELSRGKTLAPAKELIYRAFDLTPLPQVRVVLIGQDPYPQEGKAQGVSFSIHRQDRVIPGSLKNIFKELKAEDASFQIPTHGDLTAWAKQGVLLLNMALTVPIGDKNAHEGVWRSFIMKTLKGLLEYNPRIMYVLWGRSAQKLTSILDQAPRLTSGHPSPEAVNRGGDFLGNGHFTRINDYLVSIQETPISWQI